jgi:hypothetical protein
MFNRTSARSRARLSKFLRTGTSTLAADADLDNG